MKNTICFILLISVLLSGCDPEFDYIMRGKIVDNSTGKPIDSVRVQYKFYPEENFYHPRTIIEGDTSVYTNQEGKFKIELITLTVNFDSVLIVINKEGFIEKNLKSNWDEWNTIIPIVSARTSYYNFKKIRIEKKSSL